MKRYILTVMMSLLLLAGSAFANGHTPQVKGKSEAEKYIKQLAKLKESEIDYAYISATMFRQMFSMIGAEVELKGVPNPIASIKSLRSFSTTGETGYVTLKKHIAPFLQEDDNVMGLELMALSREGEMVTAIYGDSENTLVINDEGDELSVVFISGLSYNLFKTLGENGMEIGF